MVERRKPIAVSEAVTRVMKYIKEGRVKMISIDECDGYYLAEEIKADHDVPPFDKSPYDGFAIRAEDTISATREHPVTLEVIEEIGAGSVASKSLKKGEAIRIMTGAQIPAAADAVVQFELTRECKEAERDFIEIKRSFLAGDNVSKQGEDTTKGSKLVSKGAKITPGVKALLATFGYAKVPVYQKPKVGIFATGTELLDVGDELVPGKIRNSNAYMTAGQLKKAGAEPVYFGKLVDDFDQCYEAISNAIDQVDFLITTGGVSVGDYDYLPAIYKKLGAEVLFNKVGMRPGSVTTVAALGDKLLFGLSGNPSACYVGFELFVRPILLSSFSHDKPHLQKERAVLDADFPKPNPFTRFVRSRVSIKEGRLHVIPTGLDKSGSVTSLSDANALIVLPGGTRGFTTGMDVEVLLLDGEGSKWPWE
ncbi:molybdopterin biosynthesis [Alkalihalophilus pseudofirmus OF4]|uniref:Molybdopterin molybdenumtransferase n=1 Tax=Alkalihalophilus pseudofirmus (strain ATCC BAA-2126 / JCM 17055 / OF4) TaxID=398511 RepID=D3FW91_ALKPO|nr:gephyrin-like molybdotransferase Glp [Alkalihalophilus pseudofirmus]ADC48623.1 molybdopterin biosynthesis [Alkalihalophilus pseudofirmus OF4]